MHSLHPNRFQNFSIMNGIEENEKTCELDKKKLSGSNETFLFDLQNRTIHYLGGGGRELWENIIKIKPALIYLSTDNKDELKWLFDTFKINPLIQAECSEWSFKEKDFVMDFEGYFFLSMTDLSEDEQLDSPIQIKMIVMMDYIIVVSSQELYFVKYLFGDVEPNAPREEVRSKTGGFQRSLTMKKYRLDVHKKIDYEGILTIFDLFYSTLKINVHRYEGLVMQLLIESKACMNFSIEISYKELAEYQTRVSKGERDLIYLMGLIKPKKKIIINLMRLFKDSKFYMIYLTGLLNRIEKLIMMMNICKRTFRAAQTLYHTCADDTLARTGISSGEIMKFFAGMTTIFMPIALIESMWGTNVKLPGGAGETGKELDVFYMFFGCFAVWIVASFIYFRKIEWF